MTAGRGPQAKAAQGWRRSPVLRRIARNASWVFAAQSVSALLGIASLALMARALGPAGLGVLAAALAYVRIMARLLHLEPWQSVIKYGAGPLEAGDRPRLLQLVKFALLADLAGGILAGSAALALAGPVAPWLNLPPEAAGYLSLLALGLLVDLRCTGLAVLRLLDRFDLLGKADMAVAAVRLLLCAAAYAAGLGLWAFLAVALLESLANGILAFFLALRLLRCEGYGGLRGVWAAPLAGVRRANPGLLRFLWNSNVNVILRQTVQRLDVLLLSALAGPAAVGGFHIARRVAEALMKFGRPLNQALYPEFARKWAAGDAAGLRRLAFGASAAVAAAGLAALALAGPQMAALLALFFGAGFAASAPVVNLQMAAVICLLCGMLQGNALLSIGRDRVLVRVSLLASALFLAAFVPLVLALGPLGAAAAHLLLGLVMAGGTGLLLRRALAAAPGRGASGTDTGTGEAGA